MPESLSTKLTKWQMNLMGCYHGSGGKISYISSDWKEIKVTLPHNYRTKNILSVTYGGSLYSSIDPFHLLMLYHNLGSSYFIIDKQATIHFLKPAKESLYAHFKISNIELEEIRQRLMIRRKIEIKFESFLKNSQGEPFVKLEKLIYIRRKTD